MSAEKTVRPMVRGLPILLTSVWLLAACGQGPKSSTAITAMPPGEIGPSDSLALAYNPSDSSLFMASRNGLFRWRPNSDWLAVNVPQAVGFSAVVVNPDQPTTIYASGPGLGVVHSDDGGAKWQAINNGLPGLDVTALALHSFRRKTLYAWLKGDGIYRTEDAGVTWQRMPDQGPPDKDVRGLVHSTLPGSMNTGWLYAATPSGAYLSMDCF